MNYVARRSHRSHDRGMRIGAAARTTGLTVKAIRHYESINLLPRVDRVGEFREFSPADVTRLKIIAHCRSLGFSVAETRKILKLVDEAMPECPPAEDMAAIVRLKLVDLRGRILQLQTLASRLEEVDSYLQTRSSQATSP